MKHRAADGYVIDVISAYEKQNELGYARETFNNVFEGGPGDDFIPFEDLTEEIVLQWVKDSLGADAVAEIEARVNAKAAEVNQQLKNPTIEENIPWNTNDFDPTKNQGGLTPS